MKRIAAVIFTCVVWVTVSGIAYATAQRAAAEILRTQRGLDSSGPKPAQHLHAV